MRVLVEIAFVVTFCVLLICIVRAQRSGKALGKIVARLLIVAEVSVASSAATVASHQYSLSVFAYSIFFISIDWLLYYVLRFVEEYTRVRESRKKPPMFLCTLLGLDGASLLLNNWFGHAFTCGESNFDGGVYYYVIGKTPYDVHLFLSYLLVVIILGCLLWKVAKTPAMYRKKYLLVFFSLLAIILGDAVYVMTDMAVDVSVFIFIAAGLFVYYYSIEYSPRELVDRVLTMVVQEMGDAVLCYDVDGVCINANESARKLFGISESCGFWDQQTLLKRLGIKENMEACEDFEREWSGAPNGVKIYLKAQFRKLADGKGKYLGSFMIFHNRTAEVEKLQEEWYVMRHDQLTGLYNETYFYRRVQEQLEANPKEQFVLVCSNIRGFKIINDVFGTEAGDRLLIQTAERMKEHASPWLLYGRLEGDKFAVMMPRKRYRPEVFLSVVHEVVGQDSGISYPVEIYFGVYEITDPTVPVSVMCDRAFMAVNTIKGSYDERIAYYDEALRDTVIEEQELTAELGDAMENGEIQMYLQPQVSTEGDLIGGEALVRWRHPKRGMLSPGVFIPIFEKSGFIVRLDRYIWEQACIQLQKWKRQGREHLSISVNISPRDFYYLDLYQILTELVEKYDIAPKNLKLEITETAIMQNLEKQLDLISRLQNYGFTVEMDDFGSGYSSLNMLKDIQVDVLKIDMLFLGKTKDEERSRAIIRTIISLSKQLGMLVITEGVETREQVDFLTEIGCDVFQGYYFAKPMPVEDFEKKCLHSEL